jgi:protein O-GlcNAc transferase
MDYLQFINQLPDQFHQWGEETVHPKSDQFQDSLNFITGMTTANVMQLLNFAVEWMRVKCIVKLAPIAAQH